MHAHRRGTLAFGGSTAALADRPTFMRFIATLRRADWVVYAKPPFAGPEQVITYLGRYTPVSYTHLTLPTICSV